jgi:LPS sulfotransferase NodH
MQNDKIALPMAISFLLATQRSGTNLLRNILASHPQVTCYPEIFNDNPSGGIPTQYFFDFLVDRVTRDPKAALPSHRLELLEDYYHMIEEAHPGQMIVLDVKYASLHNSEGAWARPSQPPQLIQIAAKESRPVIHLVRRNSFKKLLSSCRSRQFAKYHAVKGESLPAEKTLVPIDSLLHQLEQIQTDHACIDRDLKSHPKVATLAYEDLWVDHPGGQLHSQPFEQIAQLLNLPCDFKLETELIKTTPDSLRDAVENYDEVQQTLLGTPFEWMLD